MGLRLKLFRFSLPNLILKQNLTKHESFNIVLGTDSLIPACSKSYYIMNREREREGEREKEKEKDRET